MDIYDAIKTGVNLIMKNRGVYSKKVFEDKNISVSTTGHDYDFVGYVENKTNNDIEIMIGNDDTPYSLKANDWLGLFADDNGRAELGFMSKGMYQIV